LAKFYRYVGSAAGVALRAPAGTSAAHGPVRQSVLPDARGLFTVTAEDAKPLAANGWQHVEQRQA
jgi:hypothetical protein